MVRQSYLGLSNDLDRAKLANRVKRKTSPAGWHRDVQLGPSAQRPVASDLNEGSSQLRALDTIGRVSEGHVSIIGEEIGGRIW